MDDLSKLEFGYFCCCHLKGVKVPTSLQDSLITRWMNTCRMASGSVTASLDYRSCPLVWFTNFPEFPGLMNLVHWSPLAAHDISIEKTFLFTFLFKSNFDGHRLAYWPVSLTPGQSRKWNCREMLQGSRPSGLVPWAQTPMVKGLWPAAE